MSLSLCEPIIRQTDRGEEVTCGHVLHVEPMGVPTVTLVILPLSGVSDHARVALRLPAGPVALVAYRSKPPIGAETNGVAYLLPGEEVALTLFMAGLSQQQAHACAEALAGLISWEENP